MTRRTPLPIVRYLLTALAVVLVVLTTGACNADAPTDDAGGTMVNDPALARVSFAGGVLTVSDITLDQFPGYEVSTFFEKPPMWRTTAAVTIETSRDEPGSPVAAAVVFDRSADMPATYAAAMKAAEDRLFGREVPTVTDGTLESQNRTCHYRVKHGAMDDEETTRANGVIIAVSETLPSIGLSIRGSDPDEIERLTVEIAGVICPRS